ncbi:MAG: rhomboid family intramembrane serine protease [Clostridiales bacterium]|nr:rhomboid family intramembrane serine protease [Clostridiales bacterium]
MSWLNRLERKMGRYFIPRLMYIITAAMAAIYIVDLLMPGLHLRSWMSLDRSLLAQGQVWRLITFIVVPPYTSPILALISLYFYCLIGNGLENEWGGFRFNVFYLFGILGAILAALITGSGDNSYLNLSLFLAFAALYPDYRILLFFFIPVKIKYIALLDLALYLVLLILGTWPARAALLMSLVNLLIFFGGGFFRHLRQQSGYWKTRREFRKYNR